MSDPTPEEALDELRHRAERDQFNLSLRFELARRLYHSGNYSEAIPHLQTASRDPGLRREVYKLLGQTFEGLGMDDPADAILREIEDLAGDDIPDDDPPEDERPPDAGVRAPLKPDSPKGDAAAKKFPPDDEGKGLTN